MKRILTFLAVALIVMGVITSNALAQSKMPIPWAIIERLMVEGPSEMLGMVKLRPTDTEPSSPVSGTIYFDLSEGCLRTSDGSTWTSLTSSVLGGDNTLDAAYDQNGAGTDADAAQDQSAAEGLLWYAAAGSTTVPIAQTDTTNKYVVVGYKDVGNDGSTSANLQGTLVVEYIRF